MTENCNGDYWLKKYNTFLKNNPQINQNNTINTGILSSNKYIHKDESIFHIYKIESLQISQEQEDSSSRFRQYGIKTQKQRRRYMQLYMVILRPLPCTKRNQNQKNWKQANILTWNMPHGIIWKRSHLYKSHQKLQPNHSANRMMSMKKKKK